MAVSDFFDDIAHLGQVDWPLMAARDWFDTATYRDRKRRRQAEFLVHRYFPWELVTAIGVVSASMAVRAEVELRMAAHRPTVELHRDWYY
jgi:hypothetical protein